MGCLTLYDAVLRGTWKWDDTEELKEVLRYVSVFISHSTDLERLVSFMIIQAAKSALVMLKYSGTDLNDIENVCLAFEVKLNDNVKISSDHVYRLSSRSYPMNSIVTIMALNDRLV